ncbi:hypothetical protein [Streptomyces sp. SID4985]|uniref:hypothetical protein n=1 Tax=unclassified Streptomyces TaxID=2593676 RepID=UPI00136EFDA1|nr:hypothetical protein [Streptomyces sp. SID4985]MYQ44047.1 hypothetical protein [Streptomyces sp. SID4985]
MATATLAVFGMLVGCSGPSEKRAYEIPSKLCGVQMDAKTVSPFLPGGKQAAVRGTNPVPSRKFCQINVDDERAITFTQEWWEEDIDITTVATGIRATKSAGLSDDGTSIFSGTGAVMRVKGCKNPDHAAHMLYTTIQVRDTNLADPAAMKKLATAYTKAVKNSDACS